MDTQKEFMSAYMKHNQIPKEQISQYFKNHDKIEKFMTGKGGKIALGGAALLAIGGAANTLSKKKK
jgi:phosphoribosylamine-glycine ligase